jgi:hypothetical protein
MFDRAVLEQAVDLQRRSYELLKWMADAVRRGFIRFDTAHAYATLPQAALAWIERHFQDLPRAAQPTREELRPFSNLFSTYLEASFELVRDPGKKLHSPRNHCFCPWCSWLVDAPNLRTRKLTGQDRKRAHRLEASYLRATAIELDVALSAARCEELLESSELSEPIALATYGRDLLRRLEGSCEGPASLVLWRKFAWTRQGSPKKGFKLSADAVLAADAAVRGSILHARTQA